MKRHQPIENRLESYQNMVRLLGEIRDQLISIDEQLYNDWRFNRDEQHTELYSDLRTDEFYPSQMNAERAVNATISAIQKAHSEVKALVDAETMVQEKVQQQPLNETEKAILYVKEHKSWSDAEDDRCLELINNHQPIPSNIMFEIHDLMEEYGQEHDLEEEWWADELTEEDIFLKLN